MSKEEVIKKLKTDFIEKFGIGNEVCLNTRIKIDYSWDVGYSYITKIRWNGECFEYYVECWCGVWGDKQEVFKKYIIKALSDCLGVKVSSKTEYFISD